MQKWKVGDYRSIEHTFTSEEVQAFACLTGDNNPLHVDAEYARRTAAGGQVVHGMLAAAFISTLIGVHIPGRGALWNALQINWRKMIRIGDTLRFIARVTAVQTATHSLDLEISGVNILSSATYLDATAKVMIMPEENKLEHSGLLNKRVLITGATGEVGQEICRRMAAEECKLIIWGRDDVRLNKLSRSLATNVTRADIVDLQNEAATQSALDAVLTDGPIDIFIHAACAPLGYREFGEIGHLAELKSHLTISATAFSHIAERLLPTMLTGSSIVAILTQAVLDAPPLKMSAYVAGKLAASGLVKSIAAEFGPKGIRCNGLSPGLINTTLTRDVPLRIKQVEAAVNPLRRLCTPMDVADAVAFLCGPQATFINGVNLPVTGGARMP